MPTPRGDIQISKSMSQILLIAKGKLHFVDSAKAYPSIKRVRQFLPTFS